MIEHLKTSDSQLRALIKRNKIQFGANRNLKIYGKLSCKSGKRMKKENRVFFGSEEDAISHGYRPCGSCMRREYLLWRNSIAHPITHL